jgi:hypothetical protein
LAAGVAAAGVYVVADALFVQWKSEDGDLFKGVTTNSELQQRVDTHNDKLKTVWGLDTATAGLAIGGGVAVAAAITLFILTGHPENDSKVTLRADGVRLRFDL